MKFPQNVGIIYPITAMLFNVGMDVFAKLAATGATTAQIVLFRWFFGALLLAIPFILLPRSPAKSPLKPIHLTRLCLNIIASFCLYHALGALPLSLVLTIFFLEPMIAMFAAAFLLREHISRVRWGAGLIGLLGVIIIARPDISPGGPAQPAFNLDVLIAVTGATCWATMRVLTKKYGSEMSVITLSFWLAVFTTCAAAPLALATWHPMEIHIYMLLFAVAACGVIYNYMWLKTLMRMPVAHLANLSYIALPFSYVVGFILFNETPSLNFYIGALIILAVMAVTANPAIEEALSLTIKRKKP